ncbi:MAG: protein kinase [Proteobacteria bacterium]|nr:protein kinase [Pseudomonadota bacterium]
MSRRPPSDKDDHKGTDGTLVSEEYSPSESTAQKVNPRPVAKTDEMDKVAETEREFVHRHGNTESRGEVSPPQTASTWFQGANEDADLTTASVAHAADTAGTGTYRIGPPREARLIDPDVIDQQYWIHEKLGQGGMGVVYRATQRVGDRDVALKLMRPGVVESLPQSQRADVDPRLMLAREFRTLSSLHHPNVIRVLDYGFDDEFGAYYTMELLDAPQTIVEGAAEKSIHVKLNLLAQLLRALLYLHRRGIVHRDVKPSNVLYVDGRIKVVDFGLATKKRVASSKVVGTLYYIAPELWFGSPPSIESDLYAFGVIACELLIGRLPYREQTRLPDIELTKLLNIEMTRLVDELPPLDSDSLSNDPDGVPIARWSTRSGNDRDRHDRLANILRKLLAREPSQRYSSAAAVLAEFGQVVAEPISLETPETRESFLQASEFIGRDRELSLLKTALVDLLGGRGSTWLYCGESGVGKSRLMAELRTLAMVYGASVVQGQAVLEVGSSYHVWLPVLRAVSLRTRTTPARVAEDSASRPKQPGADNDNGNDNDTVNNSSLSEAGLSETYEAPLENAVLHRAMRNRSVQRHGAAPDHSVPRNSGSQPNLGLASDHRELDDADAAVIKALLPELPQLLGRDIPDAAGLPPAAAQKRLFQSIETMFRLQRRPTLVLLEDLQWAGQDSVQLLGHLSEVSSQIPLLIVGNYRDDEAPHLADSVARANRFKIASFGKTHIIELSVSMLGDAGRDPALVEYLYRETEGNVFFLIEVLRELAAQAGQLDQIDRIALPDHLLTGGIRSFGRRRVARVPENGRALLHFAAVMGRQLDLAVLRQHAGTGDLESWLDTCANAAVLDYLDGVWRFAHDKVRDVIIGELSGEQRVELHGQVVSAVEAVYTGEERTMRAALLAFHCQEAGYTDRAIQYWSRAGQRAIQRSANVEACAHFTRGIELLDGDRGRGEGAEIKLDLLIALGQCLVATKGYAAPEVERTFLKCRVLCRELGETPKLFRVLWGSFLFHLVRADLHASRDIAQELLSLAERSEDSALLVEAHRNMGASLFFLGELDRARHHFEQCLALYDVAVHGKHAFQYGQDPGAASRIYAGWVMWFMGYPDQGLALCRSGVSLAHTIDHPFTRVFAQIWLVRLYQLRGDQDGVRDLSLATIELSSEHEFSLWTAYATVLDGWTLAEKEVAGGGGHAGIERIEEGIDAFRATGARLFLPCFLALQAEACIAAGHLGQAQNLLYEAMEWADQTDERFYQAEIYRLHAEVLLRRAEPEMEQAEHWLERALEVAGEQRSRSLILRATITRSQLWQRQGRSEAAREALAAAMEPFDEGFDTADLCTATRLLVTLQ